MSAQIVQLQRVFRRNWDWSSPELAEFYRVESALIQAGLSIDTDRGISDEGEPWFAFCRREDGEVIIHIAKIDGGYILAGPVYGGVAHGHDIASLVRDLISRHPLIQTRGGTQGPAKIFLHPAALLIAVVATAFFKSTEARALTDDSKPTDHNRDGRAAGGAIKFVMTVDASNANMLDSAQSAVILSAIASVLQTATPSAQDHHEITGHEVPAPVYDRTTAGASASAAVAALAPTAVEATNHTSLTAKAHIADSLPLVAILMDLSFTPSLVKANGQEGSNPFITRAGAEPAVGSIQLFTTTKGSASVATEILPANKPAKDSDIKSGSPTDPPRSTSDNAVQAAPRPSQKSDDAKPATEVVDQQKTAATVGPVTQSVQTRLPDLNNPADTKVAPGNVVLGIGYTVLDVSSASVEQVKGLKTAGGVGVSLDPNNQLIVNQSVADTTSKATFANITGFTVLGIGGATAAEGAGGTMDLANLPGFGTIIYHTAAAAGAGLIINNQSAALTVNVGNNSAAGNSLVINALDSAYRSPGALSVLIGNDLQNRVGTLGTDVPLAINARGDELFNLVSNGGTNSGTNKVGSIALTPFVTAAVSVTITGTHNIEIGSAANGAIADLNAAGALLNNNMVITIKNSGVTSFMADVTAGTPLGMVLTPGDNIPLSYSTNALSIDASASGGLIMRAGNANFTLSTTVAGSLGDTFIGSSTAGNLLAGSIGNDTFTFGVSPTDVGNTIVTYGGKDTIILLDNHTSTQRIEFFAGTFSNVGTPVVPGVTKVTPIAQSITDNHDNAALGWWGLATGGTASVVGSSNYITGGGWVGSDKGTSADMTLVTGFSAAHDVADFASAAWGFNTGIHLGLVNGNLTRVSTLGEVTVAQKVSPSNDIGPGGNTLNSDTNVIFLDGLYSDAHDLANKLGTGSTHLNFAATLLNGQDAHMLVVYGNTGGGLRIADVEFINSGAATSRSDDTHVHASDLVLLASVGFVDLLMTSKGWSGPGLHFV